MHEGLFDLTGKIAVVTGAGANGGIGHALALGFAHYGADIVVADIDKQGAGITGEEIESIGRRTLVATVDVSDEEQVEDLFTGAEEYFGQIDILANVPFAFPERVRPHELTLEGWQKTLDVSLTGYFLCARQALRSMIENDTGGCILNIGSIAGMTGVGRGNFPYSTAKGGVTQLTRELAVEYARQGIRVNAIIPAQVLTPALENMLLTNPRFQDTIANEFLKGIPLGRLMEPQDFIGPAVFLCSAAAAAMTGVLLPVDGGNLAMNAGGSHTWPAGE